MMKKSCWNNDGESSNDTDSDSTNEDTSNDFMLMSLEYLDNESTGSELSDKEAKIDVEGELVSALEEIDRLR